MALLEGEEVFCKVGHAFMKITFDNKEETLDGALLILNKTDGYHVEFRAAKKSVRDYHATNSSNQESWTLVDSVGYRNSKELPISPVEDQPEASSSLFTQSRFQKYNVNFALDQLKSFRVVKRARGRATAIVFTLEDGTTYPPIYIKKSKDDRDFHAALSSLVLVKQSPNESDLFLVSPHNEEALSQSFDQLNLFDDKSTAVSRFLQNPLRATLGGFARVPKLLTDALVAPSGNQSSGDEEPTQASVVETEAPTVHTNRPDEPEYTFVDQRLRLPTVDETARGEPLSKEQWSSFCDTEGRVVQVETVKQIIFRGCVGRELRCEMWKFLLGYYSWDSTEEEREHHRKDKRDAYFAMKLQWKSMSVEQEEMNSKYKEGKSLIEKDVNRTDRLLEFYIGKENQKLQQLNDILMTYMMYNFDLGYVQGMSDLLSPILQVIDNEVDAFWCFVGYMKLVGSNFEMSQLGMKTQLNQLNMLVQIIDPELYTYLDTHDSSNMYFAFRWLLILFKREFTTEDTMRLWEVLWTGLPCKNFHIIIAASILLSVKVIIMENQFGFTEILKHLNDLSNQIPLNKTLMKAEALAAQLLQCNDLPEYIREIIQEPSEKSAGIPHVDSANFSS